MDSLFANKKHFIVLTGVFSCVLVLLVIATALIRSTGRPRQSATGSQEPRSESQSIIKQESKTAPLPSIEIANITGGNPPAQIPSSSRTYIFKNIYAQHEAKELSQKFLGKSDLIERDGSYISFAQDPEGQNISAFVYNPHKGEFSYASTRGGILPKGTDETIKSRVQALLNMIFFDPTLVITAQYKRTDKPGITYFEIHRDWAKVGMPILNALGLLNLSENLALSNLNLGIPSSNIPDPTIYATSDNKDALARSNDFNTMTIGVKDEDSTVTNIQSNIRQIEVSKLKVGPVISYLDALAMLKTKKYEFVHALPAGEGVPAFDKVYPGNKAQLEKATVSETILAYLEQSPEISQSQLAPYYLFRGTGELSSGYKVKFIAAVPALENSQVKGVFLAQDKTPKQGTFFITPDPRATGCGTAVTCPSPSVTPRPSNTPTPPGCGNGGPSCPPTVVPPSPTPIWISPTLPPPSPTPPGCGNGGPSCPPTPPPYSSPYTYPTPIYGYPTPQYGYPAPYSYPTPVIPTTIPSPTPRCGNGGPTCPPIPCGNGGPSCPPTQTPTRLPTAPPPTLRPTTPPPSPTPFPPDVVCIPEIGDLENIRQVSSRLNIGQLRQSAVIKVLRNNVNETEGNVRAGDWYSYTVGSSLTADDIVAAFNKIKSLDPNVQKVRDDRIASNLSSNPDCPIRVTGESPSIFVYGPVDHPISISFPANLATYSLPGLVSGEWKMTTSPLGTLKINGVLSDYLYYEYENVSFNRPVRGWNQNRRDLEDFAKKLGSKLNLTSKETDRLIFELNHASSGVFGDDLFIGVISQAEVENKIPLSITSSVKAVRLHFYVGTARASVQAPKVTPVERVLPMMVELGAYAEK